MAKNFIQVGDIIEVVAPTGGTTSGVGYVIGAQLFGVAMTTTASGLPVSIGVTGVWSLPKATTVTFAAGDKVWWNDSTKLVTTTTATTTPTIGIVAASQGVTTSTTVNVLLMRTPAGGT